MTPPIVFTQVPPPVRRTNRSERRRVLLISYHFPPVGGAGVQRPVKFVKYLREFGWEPTVLTAANPSVPVFDESLCADLPPGLQQVRARTLEPGYAVKQQLAKAQPGRRGWLGAARLLVRQTVKSAAGLLLQPDPQVLWWPAAYRAAVRLLKKTPHDAILATAPPYSNLILGTALKQRFGLPLVCDFRDEWDLSSQYLENSARDSFSTAVQEGLQRRVLRSTDVVIATTEASTRRLAERGAHVGSRATFHCIYNGYDPDDFEQTTRRDPPEPGSRRFRLVYTGTLWNLTTVAPLVLAVEQLRAKVPEAIAHLELVFIGRKTPEQQVLLNRLSATGCHVISADYCDHSTALDWMRSADALCLLLSDVAGAERVVPAKLFEYAAARRRILGISPPGETANLLRRIQPGSHFLPGDLGGITRWLDQRIVEVEALGAADEIISPDLYEFSREHETGQLADLLTAACQRRITP